VGLKKPGAVTTDTANQFAGADDKAVPVSADRLLLEDSAAGEPLAVSSLDGLDPEQRAIELGNRLRIRSPGLAKELHDVSLRQLEDEDRRKSGLEAKASGLLQAVGISLALLTAFGGAIIIKPEFVAALGSAAWFVRFLLLAAVLAGIGAATCALLALKVTEYRTLRDEDVFNEESLHEADSAYKSDQPDTDRNSVAYYHRYMTIAHWRIYWYVFGLHKKKAKIVRYGQLCFFALLVSFVLLAGMVILGDGDAGRSCEAAAERQHVDRGVARRRDRHLRREPSDPEGERRDGLDDLDCVHRDQHAHVLAQLESYSSREYGAGGVR